MPSLPTCPTEGDLRRSAVHTHLKHKSDITSDTDGLSLDAQTLAIEHYCAVHGLTLLRLCKDVLAAMHCGRQTAGKEPRPSRRPFM